MFAYKVEAFLDGEWRGVNKDEKLQDGARIVGYEQALFVYGSLISNGLFHRNEKHHVSIRMTAYLATTHESRSLAAAEAEPFVFVVVIEPPDPNPHEHQETIVGPFASRDEAVAWGAECLVGATAVWHVVTLASPQEIAAEDPSDDLSLNA